MALTPRQTEQLQQLITQRQRTLVAEVREDLDKARSEQFGEIAGATPDAGDESDATLIEELDRAELNRDLTELRALEGARARLADGSYGTCVDCGRDIGFERLQVNPGAERCIGCQERHEKTFAGAGRPTL